MNEWLRLLVWEIFQNNADSMGNPRRRMSQRRLGGTDLTAELNALQRSGNNAGRGSLECDHQSAHDESLRHDGYRAATIRPAAMRRLVNVAGSGVPVPWLFS
jgi:hypothetical protein